MGVPGGARGACPEQPRPSGFHGGDRGRASKRERDEGGSGRRVRKRRGWMTKCDILADLVLQGKFEEACSCVSLLNMWRCIVGCS